MPAEVKIIANNCNKVIDTTERAVRQFLEEAGLHLSQQAARALEMDPRRVDTGLLRNSITYAVNGQAAAIRSYTADRGDGHGHYDGTVPEEPTGKSAVYIGTNVEYALYVHEGTMKMAPNRFLKNALEMNKDQLPKRLEEILKDAT